MPRKRKLSPQSVWDEGALRTSFLEHGIKLLHIPVIYRYLVRHPDAIWDDIPDLPRTAVSILKTSFSPYTTELLHISRSRGGDAVKLLLRVQDGLEVESVIMQYDPSPGDGSSTKSRARSTLCVSSEVGCQMGCTFCATGTMGLTADLTAGEIVEQLVQAQRFIASSRSSDGCSAASSANGKILGHQSLPPIRNVVFMGMGEPLNNYAAVTTAVRVMTDPNTFAMRRGAVTLSTVGVVPRIKQLATDLSGISLALSLHAPTQELRARIVPSARAYPLSRLMAAVADYQAATGQRVFVEYVALGNINCKSEHAHQLGQLLRGRDVVVNLIPWNPILSPAMEFCAPAPLQLAEFSTILRTQYDLPVTVRQEKGQDVGGACGQLVLEHGGGKSLGTTDAEGKEKLRQQVCGGRKLADVEDLGLPRSATIQTR